MTLIQLFRIFIEKESKIHTYNESFITATVIGVLIFYQYRKPGGKNITLPIPLLSWNSPTSY